MEAVAGYARAFSATFGHFWGIFGLFHEKSAFFVKIFAKKFGG